MGPSVRDDEETRDWVCPVLQKAELTDAVVAAIRDLNASARILDRGAYIRVLCDGRCRVTRQAIEQRTGAPFRMPADLELVMSSFKGTFEVSDDEAVWQFRKEVNA
jgi:hypothetical protein